MVHKIYAKKIKALKLWKANKIICKKEIVIMDEKRQEYAESFIKGAIGLGDLPREMLVKLVFELANELDNMCPTEYDENGEISTPNKAYDIHFLIAENIKEIEEYEEEQREIYKKNV